MDENLRDNVSKHADALIRELHAEMRAIREADLKLLPLFYASSAFVLTAQALIAINAQVLFAAALCVGSPIFVCVMWWRLHELITYNHFKYEGLGERVRTIWSIWHVAAFSEVLGQEFGRGRGYRKSQILLGATAIWMLIMLASTPFIKYSLSIGSGSAGVSTPKVINSPAAHR